MLLSATSCKMLALPMKMFAAGNLESLVLIGDQFWDGVDNDPVNTNLFWGSCMLGRHIG